MHIQGLAYLVHDEELCLHILGQGCHGAVPGRNVSLPCLSLLLSFYLTLSSHQYCHPLPFPSIICPLRHHPLHRSPLCCCQCIIDYCVVRRLLLSCRPSTIAPFVSHCAFVHPHAAHQLSHRTLTLCCPSTMVLLSIKPLVDHRTYIHHDAVVDCTVVH